MDRCFVYQQDDLVERAQQVELMGSIYNNATRVLVWLGDAEVPQPVPIQTYLFQYHYISTVWHGHNQLIERNPLSGDQDWIARTFIAAIRSTESSYWWQRAWIVQEFVLARFASVACFGLFEIEWNELRLLVESIVSTSSKLGWEALIAIMRFNEFCSSTRDLTRRRDRRELSFLDTMTFTKTAQATDPRDRVFALLSPVDGIDMVAIRPDYTQPCRNVFVGATAALMRAQESLSLLLIVTSTHLDSPRMEGLPTWAIDFTFGDRYSKIGSDRNLPVRSPSQTHWWKCPHLDSVFCFDGSQRELRATGIHFDQVVRVVPLSKNRYYYPDPAFYKELDDIKNLVQSLPESNPYHNFAIRLDKSTTSEPLGWQQADQLVSRDWSDLGETKPNCLYPRRNDTFDVVRHTLMLWSLTVDSSRRSSYQCCRQHAREMYDEWQGYTKFFGAHPFLFSTSSGFLGIAPSTVKLGDHIVLPIGCNTPIMLRPASGSFTFQGLAFVHGIMEDELPRWFPQLLDHSEEFAIT